MNSLAPLFGGGCCGRQQLLAVRSRMQRDAVTLGGVLARKWWGRAGKHAAAGLSQKCVSSLGSGLSRGWRDILCPYRATDHLYSTLFLCHLSCYAVSSLRTDSVFLAQLCSLQVKRHD